MLPVDGYDRGETDKNALMFSKLDQACGGYNRMLASGTNRQLTRAFRLAIRPPKRKEK